MPTVLITGASRGIGLEFTRQFAADGWEVIATCRVPEKAEALTALARERGSITAEALDVDDLNAIDALALKLDGRAIDLLVNNAGIAGPRAQSAEEMDFEGWAHAMRTNMMAPFKTTLAFAPHLALSEGKCAVTITSGLGSIAGNSGGRYAYRSSKAAVNMVMKGLAADLRGQGIIVALLHPGWVRTDMGGPHAMLGTEESVTGMRRVIASLTPEKSGRFLGHDGSEIPW